MSPAGWGQLESWVCTLLLPSGVGGSTAQHPGFSQDFLVHKYHSLLMCSDTATELKNSQQPDAHCSPGAWDGEAAPSMRGVMG